MTSTSDHPAVGRGQTESGSGIPVNRPGPAPGSAADAGTWTGGLRRFWMRKLPPEKLLPDRQPAFVASWIYVFGVATLAAFLVILASGLVLALTGPVWYHTSSLGHFTNSLHFWSVQLFFVFMVVHLWGKFWMAAWRGRRVTTWITGVVAFLASIATAFTGYLVQTNFDSQWISFEAKDGLNAVGIGAFFNVANLGQVLLVHACLLPLIVGVIVVWHVLMVRRRGVVPPIDAVDKDVSDAPPADAVMPLARP
jgi:ubiquinol-cytochrome c reductase cytochrome b subunit